MAVKESEWVGVGWGKEPVQCWGLRGGHRTRLLSCVSICRLVCVVWSPVKGSLKLHFNGHLIWKGSPVFAAVSDPRKKLSAWDCSPVAAASLSDRRTLPPSAFRALMLFSEKRKNLNLKNQTPLFLASASSSSSHPLLLLGCLHCRFLCYFYMHLGGGTPRAWNMFIYMQLKIMKHVSVMRNTVPWHNSRKYSQQKIRDTSLEASLPLKLKKKSAVDLRGHPWCPAQMQATAEQYLVSSHRTTNQMNLDWFFKNIALEPNPLKKKTKLFFFFLIV